MLILLVAALVLGQGMVYAQKTARGTVKDADGKPLAVPTTPVRFTNANGIMDQLHYQVYAPLKDGSVLQVSASDPDVLISTGPVVNGRATVKCSWKGLEKIYWIN